MMLTPITTHLHLCGITHEFLCHLDMLGDASSNVHMQYLRGDALMPDTEENKTNPTPFIKVTTYLNEDD